MDSINMRHQKLSKLLFKRHKKKYLTTKKELEEEIKLFGDNSERISPKPTPILHSKNNYSLNYSELKRMESPKR